jgi:hypothetical protein
MRYAREQNFTPTLVHVVDREADSVNHWRQWSADGHLVLVRANDRIVRHQGEKTTLAEVADSLRDEGALKDTRGSATTVARPASSPARSARVRVGVSGAAAPQAAMVR